MQNSLNPVTAFVWLVTITGALGILGALGGYPIALILTSLALLSLLGIKDVPADPPHVAIPTFWGRRLFIILPEGKKLFAAYFPFFIDAILISVEKKNNDFPFPSIRCKLGTEEEKEEEEDGSRTTNPKPQSGGEVRAQISITWEPDTNSPERLIDFLNSGKPDESGDEPKGGVVNIMRDMLAEDVRQMGVTRTWEEMVFGKDLLSALLIIKMTGMQLPRFERDEHGSVIEESDPERPGKMRPKIERYYVTEKLVTREEIPDPKDIEYFIKNALTDGVGDIHDLGIKLRRLNVTEVQPTGKLLENAELAALETQQRSAESRDNKTGVLLAEAILEAARKAGDDDLTFTEAHEIGRITRGRAREIIVRGDGSNPLASAAAILKEGGGQ